jgi:hypothetical protein
MAIEKMDATGRTIDGRKHTASLEHAVKFAGWSTPRTVIGGAESTARKKELGRKKSGGGNLQAEAILSGWASPTNRDYRYPNKKPYRERKKGNCGEQLPNQVKHYGPNPSGSTAKTIDTDGYQLNPRFPLWLQGYPDEWASCGERGIQSCRKSQPNS